MTKRINWPMFGGGIVLLLLLIWAGVRFLTDAQSGPPEAGPTPSAAADSGMTPETAPPVPATPNTAPVVTPAPQPQPGGTVVELVARPPDTFNPILTTNPTSLAIAAKILPRLLGQDPHTGALIATEMADAWTVSPDGRTYTFTLRPDVAWSDGTPVTAQDFVFTYQAIAAPGVQSPYRELIAGIADVAAPDARTLTVRLAGDLAGANCDILPNLTLPWLPSHLFAGDFSDMRAHPFNTEPTVGAGPLLFAGADPDGSVRLVRNPAYRLRQTDRGIWLDGWTYRPVADPAQRLALLAAGEADVALLPSNRVFAEPPGPGLTAYRFNDDGYSFVAVNLADSGEPVPGVDPTGAAVIQPPHPILGDAAVRQALAHSVDYDRLIGEVYAGYGQRLTSAVLPTVAWAYAADLPPIAYDPAQAAALLDGAGWTLNGAAIRQKDGQLLSLTLMVNDDDPARLALAQALQEMWGGVGIDITVEQISFAALATALLEQSYDLAVAGWSDLGSRPMHAEFWVRAADLPGSGLNFTSYANPQVEAWLAEAGQLAGCDPTQRAQLYRAIQAQIQADVPYIFLSTQRSALVYNKRWQGVDPGPWGYADPVSDWFLAP